jgi:hypothetical protein
MLDFAAYGVVPEVILSSWQSKMGEVIGDRWLSPYCPNAKYHCIYMNRWDEEL